MNAPWFRIWRAHAATMVLLVAGCGPLPDPGKAAPGGVAPASTPRAAASDDPRLARARAQVRAGRLLLPQGDNALETYLALRDADPGHPAATEALLELQPELSSALDAAIAGGRLEEAGFLMRQLERLDPASALLPGLRSALERRRMPQAGEGAASPMRPAAAPDAPAASPVAEARSRATSAASAPTAPAHTEASATDRVPAAEGRPSPAPSVASPSIGSAAQPMDPGPGSPLVPEPPAVRGPDPAGPRLLRHVAPRYPESARRRRLQGWVEVELSIAADGEVRDVRVVSAEPAGAFEREALQAAQRWRFEPGGEGSRVRRRIYFRLDTG